MEHDVPRSQLAFSAGCLLCALALIGGLYMAITSWDVATGAPRVTYTVFAIASAALVWIGGAGLIAQRRPFGRWWLSVACGAAVAVFWFVNVLGYALRGT